MVKKITRDLKSDKLNVDANQFVDMMSKQSDLNHTENNVHRLTEIETQRVVPSAGMKVIDQSEKMKVNIPNLSNSDGIRATAISPDGLQFDRDSIDNKFENPFAIDPNLHTGPRIFVPVDVQALVVPNYSIPHPQKKSSSKVPFEFSIPLPESKLKTTSSPRADLHVTLKEVDGRDDIYGIPGAFDQESNPASNLGPGIHLFWALPDSLMKGEEKEEDRDVDQYRGLDEEIPPEIAGSKTGISYGDAIRESLEFEPEEEELDLTDFNFPQLPDRWLIVRRWKNSRGVKVSKKWILESDSGKSSTLESWVSPGKSTPSPEMTAVGPGAGDIYWTVTYDSARNRFTFHDIPDDSDVGPFDYLVAGWYSDETEDPLWMRMSTPESEWNERFKDELRWKFTDLDFGSWSQVGPGYVDGD